MFLAEYLAFCGKRAKTPIPKEAPEEVAEIGASEFLVLPSVILDSRTGSSHSNSYFKKKTDEVKFKLEDLHHLIDDKQATSIQERQPDTKGKPETNAKRLLMCENCDYQSASRSTFIRHLRTHTLRQHLKTRTGKGKLRKRLKIHPVFACEFCDDQFAHKEGLNIHLRTHAVEKQ